MDDLLTFDGITRLILLAGASITVIRSIYFGRRVRQFSRRVALGAIGVPAFAWAVFEANALIVHPITPGELRNSVLLSRIALGLTIAGWTLMQHLIATAEGSRARPEEDGSPWFSK